MWDIWTNIFGWQSVWYNIYTTVLRSYVESYFDTYTIWLNMMSSTWIDSVDVVAGHAYMLYGSPLNHVLHARPWRKPMLSYCRLKHIKAKQLLTHKPVYMRMYLYTCTWMCNRLWSDQHIFWDSKLDCYIVYAHYLLSMFTYHHYSELSYMFVLFLCTFTRLEYANQLLLPLPFVALSTNNVFFHHQRKPNATPDNDATCSHQGNRGDRIIGRDKSTFDLCRWMIWLSSVQYANGKQCGTLIPFIVYAVVEKFTETALCYLLMNLHWQKTIHTGTAGYVMKIY